MSSMRIKVEQRGRVLLAELDNPPHNFLDRQMVRELELLVERADADAGIGAVILTGTHPGAFVTHYDVSEILADSERFGHSLTPRVIGVGLRVTQALSRIPGFEWVLERTPAGGAVTMLRIGRVFRQMNRARAVFIAAINGAATGGGSELALACDLRLISSEGGPMGQPEILLGLMPGGGSTQRLTRMIGQAQALELILEGRLLGPQEAARLGLVHRVVPGTELLREAWTIAERLARRTPQTIAYSKQAVYHGAGSMEAGMSRERALYASVTATPSALRAMSAYVTDVGNNGPAFSNEMASQRWLEGTAINLIDDA
jgi:enoyl-CoA hydratase